MHVFAEQTRSCPINLSPLGVGMIRIAIAISLIAYAIYMGNDHSPAVVQWLNEHVVSILRFFMKMA